MATKASYRRAILIILHVIRPSRYTSFSLAYLLLLCVYPRFCRIENVLCRWFGSYQRRLVYRLRCCAGAA